MKFTRIQVDFVEYLMIKHSEIAESCRQIYQKSIIHKFEWNLADFRWKKHFKITDKSIEKQYYLNFSGFWRISCTKIFQSRRKTQRNLSC